MLSGKLFANTQIPCALVFLSKNRGGGHGYRARKNEVLFINGSNLGSLIPGSRRQKQLSADEIERIARVYRQFKREGTPELVPGFCAVAALDKIREYNYALTPGRYVGASDDGIEGDPFEERYPHLRTKLMAGLEEGKTLTREIARSLDLLANV